VCAWGVARALFRDARRAKEVSLCVRPDNPAEGVAGPDVGAKKAKTYLWPSEFLSLVSRERVPVRWARLIALAAYTFTRAGELTALRWEDVDLEHGTIHVHRAADRVRKRGEKPTK
jgi:integrase